MEDGTSSRSPRDFTLEERKQKFQALKAKLLQSASEQHQSTIWHQVDDELNPEQYNAIPPGRQGVSGRTEPLWIKYWHDSRHEIVVAQGTFDHVGCHWRARYYPADDGDFIFCGVKARAWALIAPGVRPWDGPII